MNVCDAQFSDLPRIALLNFCHRCRVPQLRKQQRWLATAVASSIHTFVIKDEANVIGVLVLNFIEPLHESCRWAVISALVVDESIRGAGAGAALLEHAENEAIRSGCAHIELSSSESRTRAHQFYLRHGFIEIRKRFVKKYVA